MDKWFLNKKTLPQDGALLQYFSLYDEKLSVLIKQQMWHLKNNIHKK